jgi:hypothetical protein
MEETKKPTAKTDKKTDTRAMDPVRLRDQLQQQFEKAYIDRVTEAVNNASDPEEAKYVTTLIGEISGRCNNLTPKRRDLHEALNAEVDLELILQMLENSAFGPTEFYTVMNAFLNRLGTLCAPVDDAQITSFRERMNNTEEFSTWGEFVAPFFLDFNKFIDVVEDRVAEARGDATIMKIVKHRAELMKGRR